MTKRWCAVATTLAAVLCTQGAARADLMTGFAGNTQPQINSTQGYLNFAVFDTAGGTAGDHYGTGLAGIDAALAAGGFSVTSSYLYLFQTVNEGPDIASSSVNVSAGSVTGFGALSGLTYAQVNAANPFLGPLAAAAGNISPAVTGATQSEASATASGLAIGPALVSLNPTSLVATFSPAIVGTGAFSTLWGYTSNLAPTFTLGSIQDSGVAANGTVPGNVGVSSVVPEPSAAVLAALGALGLAGYAMRRRHAR